jgi:1,4-dihydroxy-2-naphthoate polyprenyltransferase
MSMFKSLLGPMRLPFLLLAPACALVGVATASKAGGRLSWVQIALVLLGAVSAHICVNVFNEYFDFKSGLDAKTRRTPFSGGSGTLQSKPEMAAATLALACAALAVTAAVGVYFVLLRGWGLLPLGAAGLLLLVTYTVWFAYQPLLCLLAPGVGFGVLMVMGTHFALTGSYNLTSFVAALVPTFLVSDLLLLNQFPDVEADRSIGRRHYPITVGRRASAVIYGVFLLLTYVAIAAGVVLKWLPALCLIALPTAVLSWIAYRSARRHADDIAALGPFMGMNVVVNLLTPVLLALGLFLG